MEVVSLVVAVASLGLSMFLLWREHLQQFRLVVQDAGRIVLAVNPRALPMQVRQPQVALDLIFVNTGARRGVIKALALWLRQGERKILMSALFEDLDRGLHVAKGYREPKFEVFQAMPLGKGDERVARIVFVPTSANEQWDWKAGDYTVELLSRHGGVDDALFPGDLPDPSRVTNWTRVLRLDFTADADDISALAQNKSTPTTTGGVFVNYMTRDKRTGALERWLKELA